MSASLYEYRDLDLMMTLHAEGNGGMTSAQLADVLGISDGAQGVAVRASWMRRFGMFDYDERSGLWSLSGGGLRVVEAKRRAALLRQVEDVPEEGLVDIMSHVTARFRLGDPMTAHMLRREFVFGTSPKSRVNRG
jgi:hypothetical protein